MPTVVIGNNTGNDYSGTEDALLHSGVATNNFGGSAAFGWNNNYALMLKFSGLSNITRPVTVSSVICSIYKYAGGGTGTGTFYRCLRNWIEGTQDNASHEIDDPDSCCWNEYGEGNAWTTAGCLGDGTDRVADATTTMTIGATEGQFYDSGNLSIDVEDMVNGDVSNYGWSIPNNCAAYGAYWYLSEAIGAGEDGHLPYLSVTYEAGGGTTPITKKLMFLKRAI